MSAPLKPGDKVLYAGQRAVVVDHSVWSEANRGNVRPGEVVIEFTKRTRSGNAHALIVREADLRRGR